MQNGSTQRLMFRDYMALLLPSATLLKGYARIFISFHKEYKQEHLSERRLLVCCIDNNMKKDANTRNFELDN